MHGSKEYIYIHTSAEIGELNLFCDITIAYYTHFHYIGVRNPIEMKEVQQSTIESNGPRGHPH